MTPGKRLTRDYGLFVLPAVGLLGCAKDGPASIPDVFVGVKNRSKRMRRAGTNGIARVRGDVRCVLRVSGTGPIFFPQPRPLPWVVRLDYQISV